MPLERNQWWITLLITSHPAGYKIRLKNKDAAGADGIPSGLYKTEKVPVRFIKHCVFLDKRMLVR